MTAIVVCRACDGSGIGTAQSPSCARCGGTGRMAVIEHDRGDLSVIGKTRVAFHGGPYDGQERIVSTPGDGWTYLLASGARYHWSVEQTAYVFKDDHDM